MRIAQVSPLYEPVPPRLYGGTERVVYYLTEELVRQGHEVTLFASGDSLTSAELVPCCERALRLSNCVDPLAHHVYQLEQVCSRASEFDIIHFHTEYLHFPLSRRTAMTAVTTMHGRLDLTDIIPVHREFREMPLISISNAQRSPLPWSNWLATVYHGLPLDLYAFARQPGKYLAFLGRVSPEKGLDGAIEIARRVGLPLKVAAKVDKTDRDYFEDVLRPLMDQPHVQYIGEVGEADKGEFLGNAYALLFPVDWPEPFGLVMIEALACGTPVIAYRRGSVPEVLDDGISGYLCENIEEAVLAVERVEMLDRSACRSAFEARFCAPRMALDYTRSYEMALALGGVDGRCHSD